MNIKIKPQRLEGSVLIPPSKSLSHRAIIAASLAKGKSIISNIVLSEDIKATIASMICLGAKIIVKDNSCEIYGIGSTKNNLVIDANESGSTLRFLIPITLVKASNVTFQGKNNLVNRPLDLYLDIFNEQGISYKKPHDCYLPLEVNGSLNAGIYTLRGDVSSQFITGLMFALPLLNGDSKIIVTTPLESKDYLLLTLDILKQFGIEIDFTDEEINIKGNQEYKPQNYTVEGDFSQAAFYLLADMLGANITLKGLNLDSVQGDKKIIEDIKAFGGELEVTDNTLKVLPKKLDGANISFKQTPDLGPALTVLASVAKGKSHFTDCARLRIKECDRVTCMKEELNKLGASIQETYDTMTIDGKKLHGGVVDSHNDHRLVMALAMLANVLDEDLVIMNASSINKSYPNFFADFKALGGKIYEI